MPTADHMPKSCRENWLELNPEERARFCTLCQQNVWEDHTPTPQEIEDFNAHCARYQNQNQDSKGFIAKIKRLVKKG
ncbi:MAG: hypothetical protein RLZZ500_926 [Bacteroidota bacterium]|jgi:hypothetical protein